jgi:Uma2 family endonuclease
MNTAADNTLTRHRIDVDAFYRMASAGVLAEGARVELIQGEVIDMAPIGSRHAALVNKLNRLLTLSIGERAIVSVQQPLRLDQFSEPQPDLVLLKPRKDFYSDSHPTSADVLLLIEISDTSLRYDREIKIPLYARHAIPEVWVIDVQAKEIIRMNRPTVEGYESSVPTRGSSIAISALSGVAIDLTGMFNY